MKLNAYQWDSAGHGRERGSYNGLRAERLRDGVTVTMTIGTTYRGVDLTTEQAESLANFLIDHVVAERAVTGDDDA